MNQFSSIAFFDVDKTVFNGVSGYHTVRELMRRKIIKKRHLLKAIGYNIIGKLTSNLNIRHMYELALSDMAGTHVDEILAIGKQIFEDKVKPGIYLEAIEEINRLRDEGNLIVLLSSGPYMTIKHMEKLVGAHDSYSIRPEIKDFILQKEIHEPLAYREGKVLIAQQYAEKSGVPLKDCHFYSDGYSDMPLLELVGNPVTVNPDPPLRREAKRRRWPILNFRKTLKNRGPQDSNPFS